MSLSRLLPAWPPLARCTVVCEMNRCDMSAAYDRTDGRCYWHGKLIDGKATTWREDIAWGMPSRGLARQRRGRATHYGRRATRAA